MTTLKETENYRYTEACRRLANGFSGEFSDFLAGHEKMHELMMDLASEFVTENIPVVTMQAEIDVAAELIMGVTFTTV